MLCPYCGHVSSSKKECDRCRGVFEPLSRQASQNGMGPWFIRDEANPFRPGCSYSTMKMLVARKRIVPESVLRGPSTRQFWTFAKNTPGIAHLLGECHSCHKPCDADATNCAHCRASFGVEEDRQFLGLAEVRVVPGPGGTAAAARPVAAAAVEEPIGVEAAADSVGGLPLEEASDPVAAPVPYEPYRHPGRPAFERSDMDDAQIEALLHRSGAAERAKRGTGVVVALIVAAVAGAAIIVIAAVAIIAGQRSTVAAAANGTGATAASAPAPAPAPAAPAKTPAPTKVSPGSGAR